MHRVAFLLLFFSFFSVVAYNQKDSVEGSVIAFFKGLSELNADKLREYTTDDFLLLEDGEVWTIDTLISRIAPLMGQRFKRVNTFAFIATEQSAVLVKQAGCWKIKSLHSTKKK